MNKLLLIVSILIVLISTSAGAHQKATTLFEPIDSLNYLAEYGKYIFERENCLDCHTLNVEEADTLISLDGIGGKYPNELLYSIITFHNVNNSSKFFPDYDKLSQKEVSKKDFIRLYPNDSYNSINNKWQNFEQHVAIGTNNQSGYKLYSMSSEISALINYLQTIQASVKQREIDSLNRLAIQATKQSFINRIEDPENEIYASYKLLDSASISKGQYLFNNHCRVCHGDGGKGIIGPDLTDTIWIYGNKPKDIYSTIAFGTKDGMKGFYLEMTLKDMGNLLAYIQSIQK